MGSEFKKLSVNFMSPGDDVGMRLLTILGQRMRVGTVPFERDWTEKISLDRLDSFHLVVPVQLQKLAERKKKSDRTTIGRPHT